MKWLLRKNIFTFSYILFTKHVRFYLRLPSGSLSPSSQSVPSPFSHLRLKSPSSVTYYNISSSVPSTALDIQHFLKPFTVASGEICCHTIMIHIGYILHFLVFKCYFIPCRCTIFSTDGVKNLNVFCIFVSSVV